MAEDRTAIDDFDEKNAQALLDMLADPVTPEPVRLQILNDILEQTKDNSFFETMFKEGLDKAKCIFCGHENYWLTPEDELNVMGYVTSEHDERVKRQTKPEDCQTYEQACSKKKTTI